MRNIILRHAYMGMTGYADGSVPNCAGTSADAGMAKKHVLKGKLLLENIQ